MLIFLKLCCYYCSCQDRAPIKRPLLTKAPFALSLVIASAGEGDNYFSFIFLGVLNLWSQTPRILQTIFKAYKPETSMLSPGVNFFWNFFTWKLQVFRKLKKIRKTTTSLVYKPCRGLQTLQNKSSIVI